MTFNEIQTQFDKVLQLASEKRKTLQTVQTNKYRTIGRIQIQISAEESDVLKKRVQNKYDNQIRDIYENINKNLSNMDLPNFQNPYETRKEEQK